MQNARIVLVQAKRQKVPSMNPEKLKLLVTQEMPFGKYKGRLIADLPGHYLNWFAREGFPKGELGGLLALMQEIDHNGLSEILDPIRTRPRQPFKDRGV
nr:DUF3820 family protein [Pseudomonas viridiflava]